MLSVRAVSVRYIQESLGGQESLLEQSTQEQALVQKATLAAKGKKKRVAGGDININLIIGEGRGGEGRVGESR
jgi:hypothetical protein